MIRGLTLLTLLVVVLMACAPLVAHAQDDSDPAADTPPHPLIAKCVDRAQSDSYLLDCLQAGLRDLEIQWNTLEQQKNTPRAARLAFETARDDACASKAAEYVFENNKIIPAIPETKCRITRTQERMDALLLP